MEAEPPRRGKWRDRMILAVLTVAVASVLSYRSLRTFLRPKMVTVPAGEFTMGASEHERERCPSLQVAEQKINLPEYKIDRTEVTQKEYARCVKAGRCEKPVCPSSEVEIVGERGKSKSQPYDPAGLGNFPVVCTDFNQARAYCEWAEKKLPTAAEWEKAARGTDGRIYPWGNDKPNCAHSSLWCDWATFQEVGSYPAGASPYGVLDLLDEVGEWTSDDAPQSLEAAQSSGHMKIIRGHQEKQSRQCSTAMYANSAPSDRHSTQLGFRCVRSQ